MKALIHANLYDFYSFRPDSYLLFDTAIREVGRMSDFKGADTVFDCRGGWVMPGLINGHAHIYSALVRGIRLPFNPASFQQLLEQLWWRFDSGIDLEGAYYSALVHGMDHLKSGVTTLIDHHASGAAIRGTLSELKRALCDELGMRGIFCFETSDRFDITDCIAENLDFITNEKSDRCAGMFGMHASLSLSDATLSRIRGVMGGHPVHVHVGESLEDETESLAKYGKRCVKRLDEHGLLNRNSILAHCVHIDASEAEIIAERGALVAVNALSNMNNAVGLPDYGLFKQFKIPVIIGNDSLGFNLARDYQVMLYAMHHQNNSPWQFSYDDLLGCIRRVYEFTGDMLGIRIGRLEPGYVADLVTLAYHAPAPLDETNVFGHILNGVFERFHPSDVWCNGEQRVKNYETVFDEETICIKARDAASRIWKRVGAII